MKTLPCGNRAQFPRKILGATALLLSPLIFALGQTRSVTVASEPGAIVWIDDVRYGKTDATGGFSIKTVAPGVHTLRVSADGFKETTKTLTATQRGEIKLPLTRTDDKAELAYQEAERLASSDRDKAIDAYRQAISARLGYTRAYIGLSRALSENGDTDAALAAIRDLRKTAPRTAEASAVEGRIYKDLGDDAKAIASFKRAITEGRGFQPEAYTGLGLLYKERGDGYGGQGDTSKQATAYLEAAKDLRMGLKQLSGAPDTSVLYQLLGLVLEQQKKYAEAIALYQEFLRFYPDSSDAAAVQSFIVQLKKQVSEQ
ncbi:MAG: tetratricopeptide repeat protein [Acidobacteriota bacterium]